MHTYYDDTTDDTLILWKTAGQVILFMRRLARAGTGKGVGGMEVSPREYSPGKRRG